MDLRHRGIRAVGPRVVRHRGDALHRPCSVREKDRLSPDCSCPVRHPVVRYALDGRAPVAEGQRILGVGGKSGASGRCRDFRWRARRTRCVNRNDQPLLAPRGAPVRLGLSVGHGAPIRPASGCRAASGLRQWSAPWSDPGRPTAVADPLPPSRRARGEVGGERFGRVNGRGKSGGRDSPGYWRRVRRRAYDSSTDARVCAHHREIGRRTPGR